MSLYRNLVRHTATYSVAVVISRISSFLLLPVYTRFLSTTDYGLLEILEVVTNVFGALVGIHLGSALAYFYAKTESEEDRLETIHTAVLGAHMIGLLVIGLGWVLGPLLSRILFQTPEYTIYCRVMFINFSLSFAQEMGLALLRVLNRSGLYVRILTARLLLLVSLNVTLLAVFHLGALAMLLGNAASSLATLMYLDTRNLLGVRWHFRFSLLKQQLRYAYPLGLSAIGMTFIHSGDRFFLQRYASLAEVGLYGMAYKFGTLAGYAQPIFETYWNAQVFQVMKLESGARYYVRIMTYFALTLGASAVVVGLFSQPLVRLATPKQFHAAMALCPLIAAAYAWRAVGDYFRNAFAVHRRTGKNVLVTLSGVVLGGITYSLLIPPLKLWGAAIATAITFIGMSLISYREAQKVYHYAFEWRRLWTIVICSLVVLLPCPWLGHLRILYQFLCAGLLTLLFPVLLWCSGFFEQEELQGAGKYLRQGRLFLMRKAGIAVV